MGTTDREARDALVAALMTGDLPEVTWRRPAWMADALCREYPELQFVPATPVASAGQEKAVCMRCVVRGECLAYALADDTLVGVWGGTDERERKALRVNAA